MNNKCTSESILYKVTNQITFQKQTCNKSCVSACLAMLFNVPIEQIINDFHEKYHNNDIELYEFLDNHDICYEVRDIKTNHFDKFGFYFVTVPSLNFQATNHQILCEISEDGFNLYDPQKGTGKKYYVWKDADDVEIDEVLISGYTIDIYIERGE